MTILSAPRVIVERVSASGRRLVAPPGRRPSPRVWRLPPLARALAASAGCWCLLFAAVPPWAQEFPLIDDWAFARSAFAFARGEGIHYLGWASMPQLGQWLWAVPFIQLFGESLVALRVATILLSWLGLWAFHDLLRSERLPVPTAAFVTATLAFYPLIFLLQGTFMTDVPALALALAALALYRRAVAGGRVRTLAAAAAVALVAVCTRQSAIAAPAAAAVLLWQSPRRWRPLWLAGVLGPVAAGVAVHRWFMSRPDIILSTPRLPGPDAILFVPFIALMFGSLATVPVLALTRTPLTWRGVGIPAAVVGGVAAYWWVWTSGHGESALYPYCETMLIHLQVFPDTMVWGDGPMVLTDRLQVVLTVLACLAAAGLIRQVRGWRLSELAGSPLVLFTALQIGLLLVAPHLFDRYLLPLLPGALLLAAPRGPVSRLAWKPALALLAVAAVLSVALMHDWLSWNAARWELGRRAVARGIDPWDLEGGFEWDGWHRPEQRLRPKSFVARGLTLPHTVDFCPSVTGKYALAFGELEGSVCLDREPYTLWLVPGRREFCLVESVPAVAQAGKPAH